MRKYTQLAVAAVAAAVLLTPSGFAESRHADRTHSSGHSGGWTHESGQQGHASTGRGYDSGNHATQSRSHGDSFDRGRSYDYNSGHASGAYRSPHGSAGSYSGTRSQPYYAQGRISNIAPHGGGYHVWVAGSSYPFFIPSSHYSHDRFHVGLVVRLGGYYNPRGYYDYYDGYGGYGGYAGASRGQLRGVVESIDYRLGTFVVQNEATGSFVTVASRDGRADVRAGDYVELDGDWTRSGVFEAFRVGFLGDGYRR